ncbi:MAG: hypothetical protein Kow002_09920 [Anaerolineales bacterium]
MKRSFIRTLIFLSALLLALAILQPPFWRDIFKQVEVSPESGAMLIETYQCRRCHRINGEGALKAPSLDGITQQESMDVLQIWLSNPKSMKSRTAMPDFKLSDTEVQAILAYLQTLNP